MATHVLTEEYALWNLYHAASLDKISVEVEGQRYSLKQVAQVGMPNPQTILLNMSAYPEVTCQSHE